MGKNSQEETTKQKQAMLSALEANMGNIGITAKKAGISVRTHYRWIKEDDTYDEQVRVIRDICFRNAKEHLLTTAMKKIQKGDSVILNKMLGIFLKDLPTEMKTLNRHNDAPVIAKIKYVDTPPGWEEDIREMEERARRRNGQAK